MINSVIIFVLFLMLWAYQRKSVFFYNREFLKVKKGFELLDAKKCDDD
jgi:hypothetical protein